MVFLLWSLLTLISLICSLRSLNTPPILCVKILWIFLIFSCLFPPFKNYVWMVLSANRNVVLSSILGYLFWDIYFSKSPCLWSKPLTLIGQCILMGTCSWSLTFKPLLNFTDSLQWMSKMYLSLCLHHLQLTLVVNGRTACFFPLKHWQLLFFLDVCWKSNNNHFPSSWDGYLKYLYCFLSPSLWLLFLLLLT